MAPIGVIPLYIHTLSIPTMAVACVDVRVRRWEVGAPCKGTFQTLWCNLGYSPPRHPYEHHGCFSYGDLDCFPPLLPLKSLYLSLKLILSGLIMLNLTLRLPYLLVSLKQILS